jgi:hypothetical protein
MNFTGITDKNGGKQLRFAKLATVLAALGLVLAMAGPAGADPSGLANASTASVTHNWQFSQHLAWAGPIQTDGPSVTATNNATASAQGCANCTAEAVSFQIIIASDTQTYVLTNNATSTEFQCETCTAVSVAEQWVVGDTSQRIVITPAGQLALAKLHLELAILVGALPATRNFQGVLGVADAVSTILANDVVELPSRNPPTPQPVSPASTTEVSPLAAPATPPSGPVVQHFVQVNGN